MIILTVNTHRDLCCLSSSTTTAESTGYNTPIGDGFDSTGFRIVRGYGYRFWIDRRQEMRRQRQRTDVAAKNL
jgi:hypothetical protein